MYGCQRRLCLVQRDKYCWWRLLQYLWGDVKCGGRRLDSYLIWIALKCMNEGEYFEWLGPTPRTQRYSEQGYE